MNQTLLPAFLALSLAGCVTTSDLPPDYALDPKHPEGVAVVSLTLSGKPLDRVYSFEYRVRPVAPPDGETVRARPYFDSARQHARWVLSGDGRRDSDWNAIVKGPNSAEPLDISEAGAVTGRVASLRLPAGEYEFYAWKLREPNPYGGIEYSPKQAFSYRFTVKPGQATYIGQLNLHLSERDTQTLTVEDRRERDLAILGKKISSIGARQVTSEIGRIQP